MPAGDLTMTKTRIASWVLLAVIIALVLIFTAVQILYDINMLLNATYVLTPLITLDATLFIFVYRDAATGQKKAQE